MKPYTSQLVTVTAASPGSEERLSKAWDNWDARAAYRHERFAERGYGVVPLFAVALRRALDLTDAEILACLHDDVIIEEDGWDQQVLDFFDRHPACGLLGFGGATGLGDPDIYQKPYDPMQLARRDFVSNLREAEIHGRRATCPAQVVCLDGFSLIGRREFWRGECAAYPGNVITGIDAMQGYNNLFTRMAAAGVVHHFYDGALGCYAKRLGWEVWMLPIACAHHGGLTAVGDARYAEWAKTQHPDGDAGFWQHAHRWGYEEFRDILPLQV